MGVCASSSHADLQLQLQEQLSSLQRNLPGTSFICLLTAEGELVAQSTNQEHSGSEEEILVIVAALRSAALKFAMALNQADCHAIHVAGEESVFSCYDVNNLMLAFYSDPPPDGFDTAVVDTTVTAVLGDFKRILQ